MIKFLLRKLSAEAVESRKSHNSEVGMCLSALPLLLNLQGFTLGRPDVHKQDLHQAVVGSRVSTEVATKSRVDMGFCHRFKRHGSCIRTLVGRIMWSLYRFLCQTAILSIKLTVGHTVD